ncbi:hypothetical protein [Streptomyces sp. NPDC054863]
MITSIWAGLAAHVSERVAGLLLSPACGFWLIGAGAWWLTDRPTLSRWLERAASLTAVGQVGVLLVTLLVIAASGLLVDQLAPAVLRLLQGYWPRALSPVRRRLVARHRARKEKWDEQWAVLYTQEAEAPQSDPPGTQESEASEQLLALESRLTQIPGRPSQLMPTRLGNVLRAGGTRVRDKYGLDAVHCWPALWLLLPEETRSEVADARTALDSAATWWTWSVLLAAWSATTPWILLPAAAAVLLSHSALLVGAVRYADLVGGVFDVHRGLLYEAVGRPHPAGSPTEPTAGRALTTALLRGPALADPPTATDDAPAPDAG